MGTEAITPAAAAPGATPAPWLPLWAKVLFVLALVAAYTFSLDLGALAEPDEPRYAEIAREMLVRHDFVTPTLNFVKYFEKPPLVYWLTAIAFGLLGVSDWAARLVPVLSALATLALTWAVGRHAYGRWVGFAGMALLATSPLYFAMGQTLTLDLPLTACLTTALAACWFGYHSADHQRQWYRVMYLAAALAVLTKGPVAVVLIGAVVAGFLLVQRDGRGLRQLLDPLGLLLFFAVALPWFVAVSLRNPEFVDFFVIDQHFKRYLAPREHRQPVWFYLPVVFASMLPWTAALLLAPGWWPAARQLRAWSSGTWYCLLWAGVVIGFFSLSGSKLVTYILPALPPLAIVSARALQQALAQGARLQGYLGRLFTLLGWIVIAGAAIAGLLRVHPVVAEIIGALCGGGLMLVVTGWLIRRQRDEWRGLAVAVCGMLAFLSLAMSARDVTSSYRALGRALHQRAQASDLVVVYGHYVQGIPLYSQRRVIMVRAWGELDFGSRQGDQRAYFWPGDDQLVEAWASPARMFLVINRVELAPLRPRLDPAPIEIAAEGKKVLLVNQPLP
ncbi:MAG: glycosyltransferase family 39 protein [Deltaproteobacteria bacterium]|nr:glycosyltransferase family 39 protein [Deltaproteobacteria bacterium]